MYCQPHDVKRLCSFCPIFTHNENRNHFNIYRNYSQIRCLSVMTRSRVFLANHLQGFDGSVPAPLRISPKSFTAKSEEQKAGSEGQQRPIRPIGPVHSCAPCEGHSPHTLFSSPIDLVADKTVDMECLKRVKSLSLRELKEVRTRSGGHKWQGSVRSAEKENKSVTT